MGKKKVVMFYNDSVEAIRVEIDGTEVISCNAYETDCWVSTIVEALGGSYKEEEYGCTEEE